MGTTFPTKREEDDKEAEDLPNLEHTFACPNTMFLAKKKEGKHSPKFCIKVLRL